MITIHQRDTNGKKSIWKFHSIYYDGLEGGEHREKEYAQNFKDANEEDRIEYKVEIE